MGGMWGLVIIPVIESLGKTQRLGFKAFNRGLPRYLASPLEGTDSKEVQAGT